ncbi:MAG: type II toxin-antitoxin system antitoxin, RelB/DinJ family [Eggerthellaceae bacterium]|jgi:DNA-damage-inducible protein J|nr:type II toxin-antitoxin system antitoxin, RelB/DinJ family [Eggerthellaceae bacterium]MCH4221214.1 type II toxin-antitoxin system antitoxin, RelB/DinJ family [Eggerthellaceae bacterium]
MGKDAILHVRIDPEDKTQAETIYGNMGSSLSEATRVFVRQSIISHGYPFRPTVSIGKGLMKAQGLLRVYAHHELRESEREAWIRSLSDKYATFNR